MSTAAQRTLAWAMLGLLVLAGCERERDGTPPVLAPLEQGNARLEWTGMQPCADCEGIQTHLLLAREGGRRRFVLTETYLAVPPARFVSKGEWTRERTLLQLQADDGARLGYAVLRDGNLQPRDVRGRRLATRDGDGLLAPHTPTVER